MLDLKKKKPEPKLKMYNALFYGQEKIGKTYLAARLPGAHFASFESGTAFVGVDVSENRLKSWDDFRTICQEIITQKGAGIKFLVVDRVEIAVSLCEEYIARRECAEKFQKIGFGRGWSECKKEVMRVFNSLNTVGVGVVALSLNKQQDWVEEGITQQNYFTPNLSGSYLKEINGFFDFICYCYQDKGHKRKIATRDTKGAVTNARLGTIEPRIELSAEAWMKAVDKAYKAFLLEQNNKPKEDDVP